MADHPYNNKAVRQRQSSHSWYFSGMDHFQPSQPLSDRYLDYYDHPIEGHSNQWATEAMDFVKKLNGGVNTISPWYATFDQDREGVFKAIREENYNPFIGMEGAWVTPEGNDIRQSIGGTAEGYRDDSIAAWFKDKFSGIDRVHDRYWAVHDLQNYAARGYPDDDRLNTATTKMNRRLFDEMDLANKFGLTYEDPRQAQYDKIVSGFSSPSSGSTGGFMDAYRDSRPSAGQSVKPGGFMESYLKKKAENKPSVVGLMTELKDA